MGYVYRILAVKIGVAQARCYGVTVIYAIECI